MTFGRAKSSCFHFLLSSFDEIPFWLCINIPQLCSKFIFDVTLIHSEFCSYVWRYSSLILQSWFWGFISVIIVRVQIDVFSLLSSIFLSNHFNGWQITINILIFTSMLLTRIFAWPSLMFLDLSLLNFFLIWHFSCCLYFLYNANFSNLNYKISMNPS